MDDLLLAKFDLEQFQWKCCRTDDGAEAHIRLLAGGERTHDIMNRHVQGDQTLFFAVYVDLASPYERAKIVDICRDAWKWLRYHVPIIACTISVDDDDTGHLEYHSPTPSGLEEWVARTFVVHDQQVLDLNELRTQVGQTRIPSGAGDQTWLHFAAHASVADDAITRVGFLFQSHHAPFDGPGIKLVFSRYLTQVGSSLGSSCPVTSYVAARFITSPLVFTTSCQLLSLVPYLLILVNNLRLTNPITSLCEPSTVAS